MSPMAAPTLMGLFLMISRTMASSQFVIIQETKTYDEASVYCASTYGTTLATIRNDYDANDLLELRQDLGSDHTWVGLKVNSAGEWKWDSGFACDGDCQSIKYWDDGQPQANTEECAVIHGSVNEIDNLHDTQCTNTFPQFACDVPVMGLRMAAVEEGLTTANTKVSAVETEVDEMKTKVSDVEEGLTTANTKVSAVETDVATMESKVSAVETGLSTVTSKVSVVETGLATVDGEVEDLETGLTSVNTKVSAVEQDLATMQSDVDAVEALASLGSERYTMIVNHTTKQQASNYCAETYGTTLATIRNDADAQDLWNQALGAYNAWVGLTKNSAGVWEWDSGFACDGGDCQSISWWNSNGGQPENVDDQLCVLIRKGVDGIDNLHDAYCDHDIQTAFFCDTPFMATQIEMASMQTRLNSLERIISGFDAAIDAEQSVSALVGFGVYADYALYALALSNLVVLLCLFAFCMVRRVPTKVQYGRVYDSETETDKL